MSTQKALPIPRFDGKITAHICGCDYNILHESGRKRLQPAWYAQRLTDMKVTKRFYSWPDGVFSAILWGRAEWVD